jgi:hypothetical protein
MADSCVVPTPTAVPAPPNPCAGKPDGTTCDAGSDGSVKTCESAVCGTCTTQASPSPRFVDNGDGTITDRQTCLVWEKKDDAGGIHDKDTTYQWSSTFLAGLNSAGFAGHHDWRLPTSAGCCGYPTGEAAELESILAAQYPNCTSSPCVPAAFDTNCTPGCSVTGCSCTVSDYYWSGSTISANPNNAWSVVFFNGFVTYNDETSNYYVRAVR